MAPQAEKITGRVLASTWGPEGFSTGAYYPAQQDGFFHYEGSTQPGYSGAFYRYNGRFVGMHLGSVTGKPVNIAASGYIISKEIGMLDTVQEQISPEAYVRQNFKVGPDYSSSNSSNKSAKAQEQAFEEQEDREARLERQLEQTYGTTSFDADWSRKSTQRLNEKLAAGLKPGDWAYDMDEEAFSSPMKLISACLGKLDAAQRQKVANACITTGSLLEARNSTYTAQCKQGQEVLLEDTVARQRISALETEVARLKKRVSLLEPKPAPSGLTAKPAAKAAKAPASPKEKTVKEAAGGVKCLVCGRKFPSKTKANKHAWFSHGPEKMKEARLSQQRADTKTQLVVAAEAKAIQSQEATAVNEEKPQEAVVEDRSSFLEKSSRMRSRST